MVRLISFLTTIIFVIMTLSFQAASAADETCHYCDKKITAAFVKVNDYYFHPSHFKCAHCDQQIEGPSYYFENNKFYDTDCYQEISRKICVRCNKEIRGEFTIYKGKKYHPECYRKKTSLPCARCGDNITGKYIVSDGLNYHNSCFNNYIALRCNLCNDIIDGKYFDDLYGNSYHSKHQYDAEQCKYCNGYFYLSSLHGGKVYEDNRSVCSHCLQDAVFEGDDLREILDDVNSRLERFELDIPLEKVSVHLVGLNILAELYEDTNHKTLGFTSFSQSKNILGITLKRDINIYILYGMPKMWVTKTIAHEFNHVWQGLQSMDEKDAAFCEGSCNYASYLVMKQYEGKIAEKLVEEFFKDDDPVYGEGFLRVVDLVDAIGIDAWIEQLKSRRSFPSGF